MAYSLFAGRPVRYSLFQGRDSVRRYVKDAEGHEHDDKGLFTGNGGGGKKGKEKAAETKKAAEKPNKKEKAKPPPKVAEKPVTPPPEAKPKTKQAEVAKSAHVMVGKDIQRYAEEHNEPLLAKHLEGKALPDGEPVDVENDKHGVEMKTSVVGKNRQIDMNPYAKVRKIVWEQEKGKNFHTVCFDDHAVFNANGPGQHDESKRRIFYRRGVGGSKFSIDGMHEVKDMDELKAIMEAPEKSLPPAAQRTDGKLRVGKWKHFEDDTGKGFRNSKTGEVVRAKK